jgi:hypothetical protein
MPKISALLSTNPASDPLDGTEGVHAKQGVDSVGLLVSQIGDYIEDRFGPFAGIWTYGAGAPSGGGNGDYYINQDNGDIYYKTAGVWAVVLAAPIASYLVSFYPGEPVASALVVQFVCAKAQTLKAGASGSQAYVAVPATASATFILKKNGSDVGTVVFTGAGNTGAFTVASDVSLVAGDILSVIAPVIPDTTLADLSLNIKLAGG